MQFRHAIGTGALKADNSHQITIEFIRVESLFQLMLGVKNHGRCLNKGLRTISKRRYFHDCPAKIAGKHFDATHCRKGLGNRCNNVRSSRLGRTFLPEELFILKNRSLGVFF